MDHENIFKKVLILIGIFGMGGIASSYAYDFHKTNGGLLLYHIILKMLDLSTLA
jgi:hypothetical protein